MKTTDFKKMIVLSLIVISTSLTAFAQEQIKSPQSANAKIETKAKERQEGEQNADNKPVELTKGERILRGAKLTGAKEVSLAEALKTPEKFAGETVAVSGVIVRSCKMEGCWMQLAPTATDKSVRVTFGDHAFFIPLNAAGLQARAEGQFNVKTLSKAEVDHLVNEDGAKFDNRNADGSVTEVSFVAIGVELTKE